MVPLNFLVIVSLGNLSNMFIIFAIIRCGEIVRKYPDKTQTILHPPPLYLFKENVQQKVTFFYTYNLSDVIAHMTKPHGNRLYLFGCVSMTKHQTWVALNAKGNIDYQEISWTCRHDWFVHPRGPPLSRRSVDCFTVNIKCWRLPQTNQLAKPQCQNDYFYSALQNYPCLIHWCFGVRE